MKAGQVVYRVIEVDLPDDLDDRGPSTWKVAAVTVERSSSKQIKLSKRFPKLGTLFKPNALGSLFFESPLQAIEHFLIARRLDLDALDARRAETERAIAWAANQEGMGSR